ncbi:hypothetical protein BC828DRAFT_381990 [Blastocladiella britannica]|nr:hypothetical protein BC828DRAFT_381990 [Blastocladiella britannica]
MRSAFGRPPPTVPSSTAPSSAVAAAFMGASDPADHLSPTGGAQPTSSSVRDDLTAAILGGGGGVGGGGVPPHLHQHHYAALRAQQQQQQQQQQQLGKLPPAQAALLAAATGMLAPPMGAPSSLGGGGTRGGDPESAATTAPSSSPTAGQPPATAAMPQQSTADRFGLLGLLSIIRLPDPDLNALALGSDLTSLGLSLTSTEVLYPTFVSPFAEQPLTLSTLTGLPLEPEYHLPPSYAVSLPAASAGTAGLASKLVAFSDETLFYLFYAQPRDAAQDLAAGELYARHWRYHRTMQLWLTKDPQTEPVVKTPQFERGVFVVFDVGAWEKTRQELTLYYDCLEDRPPGGAAAAAVAAASAASASTTATDSAATSNGRTAQQQQQQQQQAGKLGRFAGATATTSSPIR